MSNLVNVLLYKHLYIQILIFIIVILNKIKFYLKKANTLQETASLINIKKKIYI